MTSQIGAYGKLEWDGPSFVKIFTFVDFFSKLNVSQDVSMEVIYGGYCEWEQPATAAAHFNHSIINNFQEYCMA